MNVFKKFLSLVTMDTRWKHPFTCCVCGPTGCGKTQFVKSFLAQSSEICNVKFDRVLFYYAEWQEAYASELFSDTVGRKIEFKEGLPQLADYENEYEKKKLIILDDLMRESSSCDVILDLFTKGSHHKNISVIFISQNIFYKGKSQRDISLNTKYLIIFKNPRDRAQIKHLARQVFPEDSKFLQEAYIDATKNPHSYLFLDLSQDIDEMLRVRACIFPDDTVNYVYVPKYIKL